MTLMGFILASPAFVRGATPETATSSTPETTTQSCELNKALDTLLTIKDSDLETELKKEAEFTARKKILEQVIICSKNEIGSLKKMLEGLNIASDNEKLLRDKFLENLAAAAAYYEEQNKNIAADLTLADVKQLANDILTWREAQYNPLVAKINDFYLVTESNLSVKTAKTRMLKIQNTLNAIKLGRVDKIKSLITESSALIDKAEALNKKAAEMFWDNINNPNTNETSTPPTNASPTPVKTETTPSKTTLTLVKDALSNVKSAYDNYLKISDVVKKILGL